MNRRPLFLVTALVAALTLAPAAGAQGRGEATLGGGSDLRGGTVIELVQGAKVPPIHFVFADNPEDEPIEVEFKAAAPRGITILPQRGRAPLAPGEKVEVRFAISVASSTRPGNYPITVQLVRADIESKPGQVTNIPAVGTRFVVRVVGATASITVKALSAVSGTPVDGTLVLSAIARSGPALAVNRIVGSTLKARVGPGRYQASFLLGDEVLASKRVRVRAGQSAKIVLRVKTVDFVVVAAKPVMEGETLVVADLVASVQNQLGPIDGPATLRTRVREDGRELETITLAELPLLPNGFSEGKETYRPAGGWKRGSSYRFEFELVTEEFTLAASEQPTITMPSSSSLPVPLPIIFGAAGVLALVGAAAGLTSRRRARVRRAPG